MIKIEITGDTPRETLVAVTAWGMYCMTNDEIREAAAQLMLDIVNKNHDNAHTEPEICTPPPVVTPPVIAPPVVPPPVAPVVPHLTPGAAPVVPVAPPLSFTLDQIATAGAALVQAGKMPDLMALLGQFGVQAVTELKPEQLGPFATALRGMGAAI